MFTFFYDQLKSVEGYLYKIHFEILRMFKRMYQVEVPTLDRFFINIKIEQSG